MKTPITAQLAHSVNAVKALKETHFTVRVNATQTSPHPDYQKKSVAKMKIASKKKNQTTPTTIRVGLSYLVS